MVKEKEKERKGQNQSAGPSRPRQTEKSADSRQQAILTRRERDLLSSYAQNPFSLIRRFGDEMERLFGDFTLRRGLLSESEMPAMWLPQIDVFERDGQLHVRADLPGLKKEEINIAVRDNTLFIEGERRSQDEETREGFYRYERSFGKFQRQIPLPQGAEIEQADATFRNGVLEVTMQVPERAAQSRQLEIREPSGETEQPKARAQAAGK